MAKVSIISPIYKVEKFIGRAAESMLGQTFGDIEFVFVDDCTPDKSIEVLESVIARHPERKGQIKIIRHEENKGLPAARNTGLKHATGDYVFHWDSDDYADAGMIEAMYTHAADRKLDLVWCDWWLTFERNERRMTTPDYATPHEALRGMLGGGMKYNVWNKLARRSLYTENNIWFPEGYGMGEDMTMLLLFAHAARAGHLTGAYYHYLKTNSDAFSHHVKTQHFGALRRNVDWICEKLKETMEEDIYTELAYLKLETKYPLIACSSDFKLYRIWSEWFPEANRYIDSNRNISWRSRLLQKAAARKQYWFVWLYNQIINRFVYGVLYR